MKKLTKIEKCELILIRMTAAGYDVFGDIDNLTAADIDYIVVNYGEFYIKQWDSNATKKGGFMKTLFLALFLVVSCGTENGPQELSSVDSTNDDPLIGSWFVAEDDTCGYGFEVMYDVYIMLYLCMTGDNTSNVSYKIVEREENLNGTVIESTCDDINDFKNLEGVVSNGYMSVKYPEGIITGFEINTAEENSNMIMTFGCWQSGEFQPTQVYYLTK